MVIRLQNPETKNIETTAKEYIYQNNSKMKTEVNSAADFLMSLLRVREKTLSLTDGQLESFRGTLCESLTQRYLTHWYPEMPHKGSGYRCIRINGKMDPLVEEAGVAAGLNSRTLRKMLPHELTMWIDPDQVCYRIGENGSICVLYDTSRASPSSDLDSTGSNNSGDESVVDRVTRRIDISNDLKSLMLNFYESDTTIVTRRTSHRNRHHHNNRKHLQQQHYHQNNLNNSLSLNGQHSPPLSPNNNLQSYYNHPQQHHYNNHHLQQFNSSPQKFNYNNYHHGNTNRVPC